jgi:hypothetical protein
MAVVPVNDLGDPTPTLAERQRRGAEEKEYEY